jgi:hypothetical protein
MGGGYCQLLRVLEPTREVIRLCSPPIPSFPPIREVLAHGDAAASEIGDEGNDTGRKGAVRKDAHREVPLPLSGGEAMEVPLWLSCY